MSDYEFAKYPKTWPKISNKCKKLANYTCKKCKKVYSKKYKKYLRSHHIKPLSNGGSSRQSNLLCLCWRCHKLEHIHLRSKSETKKLTKSTRHKRKYKKRKSRKYSKYKRF